MLTRKLECEPVAARGHHGVSSLATPHSVSSSRVSLLHLKFTSQIDYLTIELQDSLIWPLLHQGYRNMWAHMAFYVGVENPNSGSHIEASTLPTETTFQIPSSNFLKRKSICVVSWTRYPPMFLDVWWLFAFLVTIWEALGGVSLWKRYVSGGQTWGFKYYMPSPVCSFCFLFMVWEASSQLLLQLPPTFAQPSWI